jgi:hypothetical protein
MASQPTYRVADGKIMAHFGTREVIAFRLNKNKFAKPFEKRVNNLRREVQLPSSAELGGLKSRFEFDRAGSKFKRKANAPGTTAAVAHKRAVARKTIKFRDEEIMRREATSAQMIGKGMIKPQGQWTFVVVGEGEDARELPRSDNIRGLLNDLDRRVGGQLRKARAVSYMIGNYSRGTGFDQIITSSSEQVQEQLGFSELDDKIRGDFQEDREEAKDSCISNVGSAVAVYKENGIYRYNFVGVEMYMTSGTEIAVAGRVGDHLGSTIQTELENIKPGTCGVVKGPDEMEYVVFSPNTKTNCFYTAYIVSRFPHFAVCKSRSTELVRNSKYLKSKIGASGQQMATDAEIEKVCEDQGCRIQMIDAKHEETKTYGEAGEKYRVINHGNHCYAVFELHRLPGEYITFLKEKSSTKTDRFHYEEPIKGRFADKQLDDKYAAFDLETTADTVQVYMAGLAWFDAGVERDIQWKGLDNSLDKMFDFIHDNIKIFSGHTFYAHNGAKFDMQFVLRDYLLSSRNRGKWVIVKDKLVHLGGAWLTMKVYTLVEGKKYTITFRDSCRVFTQTLKSLAIDLDVEHKKIEGEVNHRLIKSTNWEEHVNTVEPYLKHDCLALLEVVDKMARNIWSEDRLNLTSAVTAPSLSKRLNYQNYYDIKPRKELAEMSELTAQTDLQASSCELRTTKDKREIGRYLRRINKCYDKAFKAFWGLMSDLKKRGVERSEPKSKPIYKLCRPADEYVRDSYAGGRVESFFMGEVEEKTYYDDFTSLFPYTGTKMLPYGIPKMVGKVEGMSKFHGPHTSKLWAQGPWKYRVGKYVEEDWFDETWRGFIDVVVQSVLPTPKDYLPIHGVKQRGKLLFPVINKPTKMKLYSEEIREGIENGMYTYKLISGLIFDCDTHMKPVFESMFEKKDQAAREGKSALKMYRKITMNSLYGALGINTRGDDGKGRETVILFHESDPRCVLEKYLTSGLVEVSPKMGDGYHTAIVKRPLTIQDDNVAIAAAITSEARLRTWRAARDYRSVGGTVFYMDTDSLISNVNIDKHPELKAKYKWDGTGEALGSLKCELRDGAMKAMKKGKITQKDLGLKFKEGKGRIAIDRCVFVGLKSYYWETTFANGYKMTSSKLKGWKVSEDPFTPESHNTRELGYDDYMKLLAGESIQQTQEQFTSNSKMQVKDQTWLKIKPITKKVKSGYDKGIICSDTLFGHLFSREGYVEPLTI